MTNGKAWLVATWMLGVGCHPSGNGDAGMDARRDVGVLTDPPMPDIPALDTPAEVDVPTAPDVPSEDAPDAPVPRYALSFDGDGDEIEFPLDIGDPGTRFTFEVWVRPTSSTPGSSEGEGGSLFVHRGDCADFWLEWSGTVERRPDRFRFTVYPVAGCGHQVSAESEATSTLSEWHHVAGVFDDGVVRLYVDGTLAATTTQSMPISWTTRALGHWAGRDGYDARPNRQAFIGEIDEIRVSSTARYAGASFTPPEHLEADVDTLAAWLLDEGSGTSVLDEGAGARDGAIAGATWVVSTR